jgi:uncharacterized protein (TIGR01619 family)
MAANWKSYFSNVNGKFSSLAVDLALRQGAPIADRPWLFWVWIYLLFPGPQKLTTSEETDMIWAMEDEIEKNLSSVCDAVYCGRITTDGRRELYFYGVTEAGFKNAVKGVMARFPGYRFDFGSQREPDWNQYLNLLYPTDENMECIKNIDLLEVFKKKGDSLSVSREVTHRIYFASEADRNLFFHMAEQRGFRVALLSAQPEEDRPYGLTTMKIQGITLTEIDNTVIELFRLAKNANGFYDGWEAQVITEDMLEQ